MQQITEKLKVSNLICNLEDTVKSIAGDITTMVPTYKDLLKEIKEKLIDPVAESQKIHVETQTAKDTKSTVINPFGFIPQPGGTGAYRSIIESNK